MNPYIPVMFRDGKGISPEEYARDAYESFVEGEDSRVRREFFREYANSFYERHGTWPGEEDFVRYVEELHNRLDHERSRMEVRAEELIDGAREKPPVCVDCLKMMDYTGWLETGMSEWEGGKPFMEPVEASAYPEVPEGLEHMEDGDVFLELRYECTNGHDTGFTEHHAMETSELYRILGEEEGERAAELLGADED
ncbi:MAG: hypothetical protein ABEJ62_00620 [Candidatus Nanohaloarchaea archaeon]